MEILITGVGKADEEALRLLQAGLAPVFRRKVSIGRALPEPDFAFDEARGQYHSTPIIEALTNDRRFDGFERVLGVVERDLFAPGLNFVFGEAGAKAAVISLARLRQGFYGRPEDKALFRKRVLTEAVHELGHTYGLGHCQNPGCVMCFSVSIEDTDRKGPSFCAACVKRLESRGLF